MNKIKENEKQKLIFITVKEHNQHKEHKDTKQLRHQQKKYN